jgi:hypothetical protein
MTEHRGQGSDGTCEACAIDLDLSTENLRKSLKNLKACHTDFEPIAVSHREMAREILKLRDQIARIQELNESHGSSGKCSCNHAPCRHDAERFLEQRDIEKARADQNNTLVAAAALTLGEVDLQKERLSAAFKIMVHHEVSESEAAAEDYVIRIATQLHLKTELEFASLTRADTAYVESLRKRAEDERASNEHRTLVMGAALAKLAEAEKLIGLLDRKRAFLEKHLDERTNELTIAVHNLKFIDQYGEKGYTAGRALDAIRGVADAKCEVCNKTTSVDQVTLYRQKDTPGEGVWRCTEHNEEPVDPEVAAIIAQLDKKD